LVWNRIDCLDGVLVGIRYSTSISPQYDEACYTHAHTRY
jgi:hypothetical protein